MRNRIVTIGLSVVVAAVLATEMRAAGPSGNTPATLRAAIKGPEMKIVNVICDGPPGVLGAFSWGSHRSKLVKNLRGDQ